MSTYYLVKHVNCTGLSPKESRDKVLSLLDYFPVKIKVSGIGSLRPEWVGPVTNVRISGIRLLEIPIEKGVFHKVMMGFDIDFDAEQRFLIRWTWHKAGQEDRFFFLGEYCMNEPFWQEDLHMKVTDLIYRDDSLEWSIVHLCERLLENGVTPDDYRIRVLFDGMDESYEVEVWGAG